MPEGDVRAGWGGVLPRASEYHGLYSIAPDILFVAWSIAVELDGGDGRSPRWSRHDRGAGAADDAWRDRLLQEVGWNEVRIRHPDAIALVDSPALIVMTTSKSPARLALLVLKSVRAAHGAVVTHEIEPS